MTTEIKGGKEEWNYQRGEGWKCLGIPYKNRKAWLYIVLPEAIDGLSALIKKLDYLLLEKCTERRKTGRMEVIIPIIQTSSSINLETKLKELGITEIFSNTVNLSGMLGRPTKVEKAIHKAVIKIDEKGTEASAATGSVMVARCGPTLFYATHPFLYYITSDEGNDSTKPKDIPFMGTFC
uniref:Serpin domain-containing protein n=1 Tax=Panagrolaimus sp. PS1159 TaxID=55785 RepID=A0AC35GSQ0_9BILA